MLVDKNKVPVEGQMKYSSRVSFLGNANAKKRILVVGNSITKHGPNKEIGWEGDWGMAASAAEKDFVHRLYAMLTDAGEDVFMRISQCSAWERALFQDDILLTYEEDRSFEADIVVFRLGENVRPEDRAYFKEPLRKFIEYICPTGKTLFTTCFWDNPVVNEAIEAVAKERGEQCIDIGFYKDEKNMAFGKFENESVATHPSDEGMEAIAKAIFKALI